MKNTTKNNIFLTIAVISMLWAIMPASANLQPNVIVSSFSVDTGPDVGKNFMLSVTLTNTEPSMCAQGITATLSAGYPFIMNGLSTMSAGDLCSTDSTTIKFPLRIDPSATGGFYQITLSSDYETTSFVQFSSSSTINLYVNGNPEINAVVVNSQPLDIYPGDTAVITVKLVNDGSYQAESLNAELTAANPLEVKWAKSANIIPVLSAKQSQTMDFAVEVPKDADAKDYPMKLEVTYLDENKEQQEKTFDIALHVKSKAKFETSDDGSDIFYANEKGGHVKILLKNTGTDTARKLTARILPQFPFSADGSSRYVESLAVGDTSPVEFTVDIDKDATSGQYSMDLLVNWEDAQGKKFQDTAKVTLGVKEKSVFRKVFLDYAFLWIAAVIIIALIVMQRLKSKKK